MDENVLLTREELHKALTVGRSEAFMSRVLSMGMTLADLVESELGPCEVPEGTPADKLPLLHALHNVMLTHTVLAAFVELEKRAIRTLDHEEDALVKAHDEDLALLRGSAREVPREAFH